MNSPSMSRFSSLLNAVENFQDVDLAAPPPPPTNPYSPPLLRRSSAGSLRGSIGNNNLTTLLNAYVRGLGLDRNQVRRPSDNLRAGNSTLESALSLASVLEDLPPQPAPRPRPKIQTNVLPKHLAAKRPSRPFSDDLVQSYASTCLEDFDLRISSLTLVETENQKDDNGNRSTITVSLNLTVRGEDMDLKTRQNTRFNRNESFSDRGVVSPQSEWDGLESIGSDFSPILPGFGNSFPGYSPTLGSGAFDGSLKSPKSPGFKPRPTTPRINTAPQFSSSIGLGINPLTASLDSMVNPVVSPSQRFRLRKQLLKKNLKAFQKEVDEINTKDEVVELDSGSDLFFNIPYAAGSTTALKSNGSVGQLTILPLVNDTKNSTNDMEFANDLLRAYSESLEMFVKDELERREKGLRVPAYIISQLPSDGYPAMRMMSPEKLEHLSATRPMWLPPKLSEENHKHEQQILEAFENYSKREIDKKERNFQRLKNLLVNNQKWFEITVKHKEIHRPVIYSMRHLCWKTNIPTELRAEVWKRVLEYWKDRLDEDNEGKKESAETYESLCEKLEKIDSSYLEPEVELIAESLFPRIELFQKGQKLNESVKKVLLCKKISSNGLNYGDEMLIAVFLLYFEPKQAYEFLDLFDEVILNDVFKHKFNNNLKNNYTMKKYLSKHFKDEMEEIHTRNLFKIMMKIEPDLIIKVMDFMVLHNNYRVCYCLMLLVLKFYHFGFADLAGLVENDSMSVDVEDEDEFLERFHYYYKKL